MVLHDNNDLFPQYNRQKNISFYKNDRMDGIDGEKPIYQENG